MKIAIGCPENPGLPPGDEGDFFYEDRMSETLKISYVKCGFCTAKNHCAACGAELAEALRGKPEVASAAVDLLEHTVSVDCSLSRDGLEDLLDGMGLMLEG